LNNTLLQYYCGNCKNILKEIDYEIPSNISIESCPFCGTLLSDTLQKRSTPKKQKLEVVFQRASQFPKLTFGITPLDTCLNFLSTYDKICITGIETQDIIERLCVRAQMSQRYGGIETKVLLIDGANTTDLYQCVDYAQRYGLDVRKILQGIISSRTFTVYQIAEIIMHELENTIKHYKAKIVIITNLLHFFTKGVFLDSNEMSQILKQVVKMLQKINDCLIVMTTESPTCFDNMLYKICTKTIKMKYDHDAVSLEINNNGKKSLIFLKREEIDTIYV
jgi:hypothetical protein